jgi:CheY-like chemotaxis protein
LLSADLVSTRAKPRLLVVDDDLRYVGLVAQLLDGLAEVERCTSGGTALETLRARAFDWVLLDIGLPDVNGFELLERIRGEFPAVRVVLHTGAALVDGRRRAIAAGAIDLLEKPLRLAYLTSLLGV